MNFTRAMIDLAKEIRRRAPSETKPSLKMANPDFFTELGKLYQATNDAVLTALIKEICELAGDPWTNVLEKEVEQPTVLKTYRGQMQYDAPAAKPAAQVTTTTRIYRGQVVKA